MIRIALDLDAIEASINEKLPTWLERAKSRNETARKNGSCAAGIWSEIKSILLDAQFGKCAFCERVLRTGEGELRECDVEHYRPQNAVEPWPESEAIACGFGGALSAGKPTGYLDLAHSLDNLLVACKICNQEFKKCFFPIFGVACEHAPFDNEYSRKSFDEHELPVLYHPSDPDVDGELTFHGCCPMPAKSAKDPVRARLNIRLLGLNVESAVGGGEKRRRGREGILRERCEQILIAYNEFANESVSGVTSELLARMRRNDQAHALCVRAFLDLCEVNADSARTIFENARLYLSRAEPVVFANLS